MTADASVPDAADRIDKLTQALLHVAGELWVLRDRQAVLEGLLADAGIVATGAVDRHRLDGAPGEGLAAEREAFVAGILAYLAPDP